MWVSDRSPMDFNSGSIKHITVSQICDYEVRNVDDISLLKLCDRWASFNLVLPITTLGRSYSAIF